MLPVHYENHLVGHMQESGVGLSFAYAAEWLTASETFPISLTMPLRAGPYPSEVATPWFANLLPEDRILEQIGRLLGRSQADVYGLLEEIGRETAGALSIGGPESVEHADYRELNETELAQIIARLPERPLLAGEQDITMSLAGAQTKLAVAVFDTKISLPLRGAASTHILKPESDRLYASVENELLCMHLGAKAGLAMASTTMGVADGRRYLLVQRYDRDVIHPRKVRRAHQEDFCQALGFYPTQKYEARRGPGLSSLFEVIDQHVHRSSRDRLALLDLVIFGCCIGDTDRHGKNYSLILTDGEPRPRLAPGYDFISALQYEGITRNLAMKIGGKNRAEHLERRYWERFAQDVGLSPAATVNRVEELATAVAAQVDRVAGELAGKFPANRDALQLFSKGIHQRAARIAANSRRGPSAPPKRTRVSRTEEA
jgi:serine/threonine-protein kinase HipA